MIQLKNATQEVVTDVEEHHTRRIVSSVDATSHLKSTEQSSLSVIATTGLGERKIFSKGDLNS